MDQTREKAAEVIDQAKEKTGQVVSQVTEQAKPRLESQKEQAVSSLSSAALALRQSGGHLREQQEQTVAQFAETAAEQVDRAASFLRARDVDQLLQEVEQFARRKPYLFLGATAALGLMGGRFLKSSGHKVATTSSGSNGVQRMAPATMGPTGARVEAYSPSSPPAQSAPLAQNPTWTLGEDGGVPSTSDAGID